VALFLLFSSRYNYSRAINTKGFICVHTKTIFGCFLHLNRFDAVKV